MRVLGINGSPHKDGNTSVMLGWVLDELEGEGISTELFHLAGRPLAGCIDCRKCFQTKDKRCGGSPDALNEVIEKILDAEGVVIGAPTYFANVSANVKALLERVGMVNIANDWMLKRKVGAAAIVARRGGAIDAFNAVNHLFLHAQMIVPGSSYWNMGYGWHGRDVEQDAEAEQTMRTLGQNIAWVLKRTVSDPTD
ncbi:MAG: flavodoxin family protein [bacterium]